MNIKLHVQGIKGSGLMEEGEEASILFGGLLEVNGQLMEEAIEVRTRAREGFFEVTPVLVPGSFEVVVHTKETWPELNRRIEEQQSVRTMSGQLIARVEE